MYSVLYDAYFAMRRVVRSENNSETRSVKLARKAIGYIETYYNVFLKRYYLKHPQYKTGIIDNKREQRIIVSLTSFPARIDTIWMTIESLFQQTVKADEIILWLAEEQFEGKESLPKSLLEAEKRGLTIRFCEDLRSHKKYFYTMQEYPDDLIILADDDAFYPRDMIAQLMKLHEKYPEDIISSTSILLPDEYHSLPSKHWHAPDMKQKVLHSYFAQPFTGCGTMYPPHSLHKEVFNKEVFRQICPYADDLWLYFMALKAHTPVTAVYPYRDIPMMIYGTAKNGLWQINGQDNKNDEQWEALLKKYGDEDLPGEIR